MTDLPLTYMALAETVRRDACPLRRSFVEREEGSNEPTPLAGLLRTRDQVGGKGGGLRIALLMSLIWVNVRPPYSTRRVAAYWAELLGRDDPHGEGARAVRDALHELAERGSIVLHTTGPTTEIILCNEAQPVANGRPQAYSPPYNSEPYLQVPRTFWTEGLAGRLSGAGISMYLCALALTRHDEPEFFISANFFESAFGISRSSRKRGLAELIENRVLSVRAQESIDMRTFRRVRRNVYKVAKRFRQVEAWSDPSVEQPATSMEPKKRPSKRT